LHKIDHTQNEIQSAFFPRVLIKKTAELPEKPEISCEKMSISPWKTFQKGKVAHSQFWTLALNPGEGAIHIPNRYMWGNQF
jgi:hypothetical protein